MTITINMMMLCVLCATASVQAQVSSDAEQRAQAGQAWDAATAAVAAGDWEAAAQYYETADRLAPMLPALLKAIHAHEEAGDDRRAASLALKAQDDYADLGENKAYVDNIVEKALADYALVEVACDGECHIDMDARLMRHPRFFLQPGDHEVLVHFESGSRSQSIQALAGQTLELTFDPPLVVTEEEDAELKLESGSELESGNVDPISASADTDTDISPGTSNKTRFRFGRPVFFTSGGLMLAAGGATAWSAFDTKDHVAAYEDAARNGDRVLAQALLDDGRKRERRTNILIGATAGLAAVTATVGLLTDWSSSDSESISEESQEEPSTHVAVGFGPAGGGFVIERSF